MKIPKVRMFSDLLNLVSILNGDECIVEAYSLSWDIEEMRRKFQDVKLSMQAETSMVLLKD